MTETVAAPAPAPLAFAGKVKDRLLKQVRGRPRPRPRARAAPLPRPPAPPAAAKASASWAPPGLTSGTGGWRGGPRGPPRRLRPGGGPRPTAVTDDDPEGEEGGLTPPPPPPQVEFYFSDSNLPKDNFLKGLVEADAEGFVGIATLCTFQRLRDILHMAGIRIDVEPGQGAQESAGNVPAEVIAAIKDVLAGSETLAVSDDGKVKRVVPLKDPEEASKEVDERSLFAKPFPMESKLEDLQEFFGAVKPVKSIRMMRHSSRDFMGAVFVEFDSVTAAQEVLGMKLENAGVDIHLEMKVAAEKRMAAEAPKPRPEPLQPKRERRRSFEPHDRRDAGPSFTPGLLIKFTIAAGDEGAGELTRDMVKDAAGGKEAGLDFIEYLQGNTLGYLRFKTVEEVKAFLDKDFKLMDKATTRAVLEGEEEEKYWKKLHSFSRPKRPRDDEYDKGLIVKFSVAGPVDDLTREAVKAAVGGIDAGLDFIEYHRGNTEGHMRFKSAERAKACLEKDFTLLEKAVTKAVLEGEEEASYWARIREYQSRAAGGFKRGRGGGRGRGRKW